MAKFVEEYDECLTVGCGSYGVRQNEKVSPWKGPTEATRIEGPPVPKPPAKRCKDCKKPMKHWAKVVDQDPF